jgi:hypothetical protein
MPPRRNDLMLNAKRKSLYSGIPGYSEGHFLSEKDTINTILLSDNGKDLKWLRHEARCL